MDEEKPIQTATEGQVESAWRLYSDTRAWYDNADTKAQVILTLDGAFIAFLTATIFRVPNDIAAILAHFGWDTWLLLALMAVTLVGSIGSASGSLWSRVDLLAGMRARWFAAGKAPNRPSPEDMWFFRGISRMAKTTFMVELGTVDRQMELEAVSANVFNLSRNVTKKHRWVNIGFVLTGMTLLLFLGAGVTYLLNLARLP